MADKEFENLSHCMIIGANCAPQAAARAGGKRYGQETMGVLHIVQHK